MIITEATDEYVLSEDAAEAMLAGAPWQRMVTVGDSVAEGIREAVPPDTGICLGPCASRTYCVASIPSSPR